MQTNVCQGVFAGGEIEPGVFHDVERPEDTENEQDDSYTESPAESE